MSPGEYIGSSEDEHSASPDRGWRSILIHSLDPEDESAEMQEIRMLRFKLIAKNKRIYALKMELACASESNTKLESIASK